MSERKRRPTAIFTGDADIHDAIVENFLDSDLWQPFRFQTKDGREHHVKDPRWFTNPPSSPKRNNKGWKDLEWYILWSVNPDLDADEPILMEKIKLEDIVWVQGLDRPEGE